MTSVPQALSIGCPEDAIAATPFLLGFHPVDSLVVIGSGGPSGSCALRADLVPVAEADDLAEHLIGVMAANQIDTAIILGYGPDEQVTPLLRAVHTALADLVTVNEVLRIHENRWWSLLCDDPACCDPDGTIYDSSVTTVAAQATRDGQAPYSDRAELARTVCPVEGAARARMAAAMRRAEADLVRGLDPEALAERLVTDGVPYVRNILRATDPFPELTEDEIARLGIYLTHLRVRDEAWVRTGSEHLDLWRDVTRRTPGGYVAGPASLLAYAAYLGGDGALANIALDRADAALPGYSMAGLVREAIRVGVPPRTMRLRLTPEVLDDLWADQWAIADQEHHAGR